MLGKGSEYVAQGDYDSAFICYDIALKLSPEDPSVFSAMADMFYAAGEYDQALDYMERALSLSPADGELYLAKANILYAMGRFADAETAVRYAEICGVQPDNFMYLNAAVAYTNAKAYEKAVEMFDSVPAEEWNANPVLQELYGKVLIGMGDRARAEALGLVKAVQKDTAIADALQNRRTLSLKTIETDISGLPVFCSAEMFEEAVQAYGFENALGEAAPDGLRVRMYESLGEMEPESVNLLAMSPSGSAALYRLNDFLALCRDGEITLILPNYNRGAQNEEYAPRTYGLYNRFARDLEIGSVAWSPDERYFTLTFPEMVMKMARYLDLIVADTRTGDLFITEATPKKVMIPGCQTAVTACFDAEGKNIYYAVYGDIAENAKSGIKRYNLESKTAELLYAIEDYWIDRLGIWQDAEGALRFIADAKKNSTPAGIAKVYLNGEAWDCAIENFPNNAQYQFVDRYQYSANSGAELMLNKSADTGYKYFTLRQSDDTEAISNAVMLPKENIGKAELIAIENELAKRFDEIYAVRNGMITGNAQNDPIAAYPWMDIINAEMSLDGCYALVLAANGTEVFLYILDMQTLLYSEVKLPEGMELQDINKMKAKPLFKMLAWNEDGTIMIPCKDGNVVCSLEIG